MDAVLVFLGCLLIGAVVSGVIMFIVRRNLKSVRSERTACNYVRRNSFRTTTKRDSFLYNTVTRIPRSQNNSRGGRRR